MTALTVTTDDLALFLDDTVNTARAQQMLNLAVSACTAIMSPLTDQALGTVLSVAARGYRNPEGVASESLGNYSVRWPSAGIFLTKAEQRTLLRLAGRGGAFSIDPTPTDAGTGLSPWDQNVTWLDGVPVADDTSTGSA